MNSNWESGGGAGARRGRVWQWALERDDEYGIGTAMLSVMRQHLKWGLPESVRRFLTYGQGLANLKSKIRPIVMLQSLMWYVDRLAKRNIESELTGDVVGHHQLDNKRYGTQIGAQVTDIKCDFLEEFSEQVGLNPDVDNAFTSVNRRKQFSLIKQKLPNMNHHFLLLYGRTRLHL